VVVKSDPFNEIVGVVTDKHDIAFVDVELNDACFPFNVVVKSDPFKLIVGVVTDKHDIAFVDVELNVACLVATCVSTYVFVTN
jgi:DNA polymerase III sliding clamp (beta) subunit (PCNA family)